MASRGSPESARRAGWLGSAASAPGPVHWRQRDHQLGVLPVGGAARYRHVRAESRRHPARPLPAEVTILQGDAAIQPQYRMHWVGGEFDVVNWVVFTTDHIEADLERFRGRIGQYVFISSASAYQTPPSRVPVTESTSLSNPHWHYSRDKIACEDRLVRAYREEGFRRRSCGRRTRTTALPCSYYGGWTVVERMRQGKDVIVHGDGTSLWTLTHSDDFARGFVPLLGNTRTIGEAFQITSTTC